MALIGGDDDIGQPEGLLLEPQQDVEDQAAAAELRPIHLRRQVMMVEEERLAEQTPEPAQEPIGLRWIAGMENVEAAPEEGDAKRKQRSQQKAPDKFRREAELARRVEGQGIAEDFDPLEQLVARFEAFRLRANDADVIAGLGQGRRLEPHAAIEGHGEVLHDDQYASSAHAIGISHN